MFQYLASGQPAAEGVDNSHQGAPGWAGERLERQVQGEKSSHHGSRLRKILAVKFSTLFPHLYSAWLTCDHSCILKRTCLYLCIPTVFIIVIVFYTHGAAEVKMVNVPKARNTYCAKCNKHGKFKVGVTLMILLLWQCHLIFNSGDTVQEVCWEQASSGQKEVNYIFNPPIQPWEYHIEYRSKPEISKLFTVSKSIEYQTWNFKSPQNFPKKNFFEQ